MFIPVFHISFIYLCSNNGGYSIWVCEAFGEFWGFQESYWSYASGTVDTALYPVYVYSVIFDDPKDLNPWYISYSFKVRIDYIVIPFLYRSILTKKNYSQVFCINHFYNSKFAANQNSRKYVVCFEWSSFVPILSSYVYWITPSRLVCAASA